MLVLGALWLVRRRRLARIALGAGIAAAVIAAPSLASAQAVGSRAIERIEPATGDSEWFALDSMIASPGPLVGRAVGARQLQLPPCS